jgi:hypothetical protein
MSEHPLMFGFGKAQEEVKNYPMVFTGHYLVGGNPDDLENGYWDTQEQAIEAFATQFQKLAEVAKHQFLFVRRPPMLTQHKTFEDKTKYRMVGRFSIGHIKEKQ